ncbi:MAG: hypothetical protein PHY42_04480 [Bacilli bacterium]|nr:hypothetical protein [Bacilli bacterium]
MNPNKDDYKLDEENKDSKKQEDDKSDALKQAEEDLKGIIQDLEDMGVDSSQIKVVRTTITKKTPLRHLLDGLKVIPINIILIMSISGYFTWANTDSIWNYCFYALIFSGIELVLHSFIQIFGGRWVIKTMGLILSLPSIIALSAATLISRFLEVTNVWRLLLMYTLLMIIRTLIIQFIRRRFIYERNPNPSDPR